MQGAEVFREGTVVCGWGAEELGETLDGVGGCYGELGCEGGGEGC